MAKNVLAVYDQTYDELDQFAVDTDVLLKDALCAFFEKNKEKYFGTDDEDFMDFQTALSASSSVEDVHAVLIGWDIKMSLMQV